MTPRQDAGWHDPMTPAIYAVFWLGVALGMVVMGIVWMIA